MGSSLSHGFLLLDCALSGCCEDNKVIIITSLSLAVSPSVHYYMRPTQKSLWMQQWGRGQAKQRDSFKWLCAIHREKVQPFEVGIGCHCCLFACHSAEQHVKRKLIRLLSATPFSWQWTLRGWDWPRHAYHLSGMWSGRLPGLPVGQENFALIFVVVGWGGILISNLCQFKNYLLVNTQKLVAFFFLPEKADNFIVSAIKMSAGGPFWTVHFCLTQLIQLSNH